MTSKNAMILLFFLLLGWNIRREIKKGFFFFLKGITIENRLKKQRERGERKKRDRVRRRRSRTLILRLEFSIFVHNHKALRSLKNLFGFFFPRKEVLYFEALIGIDSLSIFIFFSSKPGWNFNSFSHS